MPAEPAPRSVTIHRVVLGTILQHAQTELPNECCGLLIGSSHRIEQVRPAVNLKPSPTGFLIDPSDHFRAIRAARSRGQQVVGSYHSHPATPPIPSPTDVVEAGSGDDLCAIVCPCRSALEGPIRNWFGVFLLRATGAVRVDVVVDDTSGAPRR